MRQFIRKKWNQDARNAGKKGGRHFRCPGLAGHPVVSSPAISAYCMRLCVSVFPLVVARTVSNLVFWENSYSSPFVDEHLRDPCLATLKPISRRSWNGSKSPHWAGNLGGCQDLSQISHKYCSIPSGQIHAPLYSLAWNSSKHHRYFDDALFPIRFCLKMNFPLTSVQRISHHSRSPGAWRCSSRFQSPGAWWCCGRRYGESLRICWHKSPQALYSGGGTVWSSVSAFFSLFVFAIFAERLLRRARRWSGSSPTRWFPNFEQILFNTRCCCLIIGGMWLWDSNTQCRIWEHVNFHAGQFCYWIKLRNVILEQRNQYLNLEPFENFDSLTSFWTLRDPL